MDFTWRIAPYTVRLKGKVQYTFLWTCLSLYPPVSFRARSVSARKVRPRLSYVSSTPTCYISIFNTTLFVESQLKGSLKIDLRSIGRSVEILVNGHVGEIIKSTTGLLQWIALGLLQWIALGLLQWIALAQILHSITGMIFIDTKL